MSLMGRHDEFVAGGTGHSPCVDRRALAADRFLSAADAGAQVQSMSGFGTRRHSTAERDRPMSV
jgi:hypothetical protein